MNACFFENLLALNVPKRMILGQLVTINEKKLISRIVRKILLIVRTNKASQNATIMQSKMANPTS